MSPEETPGPGPTTYDWRGALMADLREVGLRRPWGRALMAVGWVHLAFFLACQAVYIWGGKSKPGTIALWGLELFAVLLTMRRVAGPGWFHDSPGLALVLRIWVTFLILSFNLASLNGLIGWDTDWFKPAWCTLASFGFATLAWLFGVRYLAWAVQMYFTGLLMVQFPGWNYLINGLSWLLILEAIGLELERKRARWRAEESPRPATAGREDTPRRAEVEAEAVGA